VGVDGGRRPGVVWSGEVEGEMGVGGGRWAGLGVLGVACLLGVPGLGRPEAALARETRVVADDRYELTVGFVVEPAYEGEPNGLSIRIVERYPATPASQGATGSADQQTTPGEDAPTPTPVPGSELRAVVAYGDLSLPLTLEPAGQPGVFRAAFVPTQPGDYVFRITGRLADARIDEEFRTGADGIPAVIGIAGLQFPAEVPVGQGLVDALTERQDEAERARTLGVVGIALGVVGLLAGGLAIVLSRRPPPAVVMVAAPPGAPSPSQEAVAE
jgi:hypothetical protein